jgi:hypothetical protein
VKVGAFTLVEEAYENSLEDIIREVAREDADLS